MSDDTGRTPHPEEPAEGSPDINPEHNTAPDGRSADHDTDELDGNAQGAAQGGAIQGDSSEGESPRGAIQGDAGFEENTQGAAQGGAIQGDSSHGESPRGAIQGDASPDREAATGDAALGGDETTEEQLDADTEVEQDTLRTLDPNDPPA
ncbi:hypothetical protein [Microbacterium sp. H83]|uniref:hypothetical protein n=1 Tax=Microbacterium sp. H83 TaxID=1827324 RepID=UPI0007F425F3|nr:hypothetical protein [Microbacterium sp. H83]OAN41633.1 hypothetical protein A4X16_10525 [Microbacterium sp. H83]